MENYHLTKTDDHWQLMKENGKRASLTGATKKEVVEKLGEFFQNKEASVKIHGEDGTMQEERTYPRASDPAKTRG